MKLKMLQVEEDTHKLVKKKALEQGKSIKEYLKDLVKNDTKW